MVCFRLALIALLLAGCATTPGMDLKYDDEGRIGAVDTEDFQNTAGTIKQNADKSIEITINSKSEAPFKDMFTFAANKAAK